MKLTPEELCKAKQLAWENGRHGEHEFINESINEASFDNIIPVIQALGEQEGLVLRSEPLDYNDMDDKDSAELSLAFKAGFDDTVHFDERKELRKALFLMVHLLRELNKMAGGFVNTLARHEALLLKYPAFDEEVPFDPSVKLSCEPGE